MLIVAFAAIAAVLSAADKPAAPKSAAKAPASQGPSAPANQDPARVGLIFGFQNLLSDILPYDDGYQSGVGAKYWLNKTMAIRGLASFRYNTPIEAGSTAPATTDLGLGAAFEYHPKELLKASPYFGGGLGTRMTFETGAESAVEFSLAGIGGIELKITDNISVYGEYQLLATIDSQGFTVSLANLDNPQDGVVLGLLFYF
jgi:opacity protein-like surface antigen